MTVPSELASWGPYIGNDVTFMFPFTGRIFSASDLIVKKHTIASGAILTLTINVDYIVSGVNSLTGGFVSLTGGPLSSAYKLTIDRIVSMIQGVDVKNQGAFHAEIHEDVFDRLSMVDQQLSKRTPIFDLPQALQVLRWKSDLSGVESVGLSSFASMLAALSTGRITFADSGTSINTDAALLWNNSTKQLMVGTAGIFDSTVAAATKHQLQIQGTAGDFNEWGLSIQMTTAAPVSPAAPSWRAPLIVQMRNLSTAGAFAVDTSAVVAQVKNNTTTDGRAITLVAEAYNEASADGLLIGLEAGIGNLGSVVTNLGAPKPKVNIWLASHTTLGYNKATAGIAFSEDLLGWHYGMYMRNITDSFIVLTEPGSSGNVNGIHFLNSANWGNSIILPNNRPIAVYNAAGSVTRNIFNMDAGDTITIGSDSGATGVVLYYGLTERLRIEATGTRITGNIGLYGAAPVAKPTITGSRGGNAALTELLTALAGQGQITDNSTA